MGRWKSSDVGSQDAFRVGTIEKISETDRNIICDVSRLDKMASVLDHVSQFNFCEQINECIRVNI